MAPATTCPPGTMLQATVFATCCTVLFPTNFFALPKRPPFFLPSSGAESGGDGVRH